MKISKEIKVAIFVLVAGTMLYTGFNFLKGIDFFSSTNRYYAIYPNVSGLQVSNAIMVNGLTVGRVSEITIMDNENQSLKVAFDISRNVIVGDSSKAVITSPDLLGGKVIVIDLKNRNKPLPANSILTAEIAPSLTDELSKRTDPILNQLELTLKNVNYILNDKNIGKMLANLEKMSGMVNNLLASNSANIEQTTKNLSRLSASLVESEKELKPLLKKVNTFADSLNKMQLAATIEKTNKSMEELSMILTRINKGEGSLGKFAKDDSLYINLNHTARDLDKLLIDLKERPKRYVHFSLFGGKPK